jgi:hypothetical protein
VSGLGWITCLLVLIEVIIQLVHRDSSYTLSLYVDFHERPKIPEEVQEADDEQN